MAMVVNPALVHRQSRELRRLLRDAAKRGLIPAAGLREYWLVSVPDETDQEFLYRLSWRYQKLKKLYDPIPLESRPPEFWALALCYSAHHYRLVRRFWIWVALGILLGTVLGLAGGPLGVAVLGVAGSMAGIVVGNLKTGPRRPQQELADRLSAQGDGDIFAADTG